MVIKPQGHEQRQGGIQRQNVDRPFAHRDGKENEHGDEPDLQEKTVFLGAKTLLDCIPQNEGEKETPWRAKGEKIGQVIIGRMIMTGAAGKPAKVLLKDLAIKKAFPSTRNRHYVPTRSQYHCQNNSGMQAKLRNQIPSSLHRHKRADHKRRQHDAQRPLGQGADPEESIKDVIP